MKILHALYGIDCRVFQTVNRHFENKILNPFFRIITHLGGARFTIAITLLLMLAAPLRIAAFSSALSLLISHLPVHFAKRFYPRKRPYLTLADSFSPDNPLKDHSFPSGHTTAIFAIIIPFTLLIPYIGIILIPLACIVGISRIYLGLHYPTDVLAGSLLGTITGIACFFAFHS
ncbi:phosphatase PAP2 family protein [Cytobacillus gottheilii]|uniref:phosphatase PAP2 family protein n=1 Tax=Cytobacillus gottheilii TaxID=859144 RepID=UPI00082D1CED|nr:phosphatase PAP2 family protein [Cytobacillus gottheilii]